MLTLVNNDTTTGTQRLPIDCIDYFEGNPRLVRNPEYVRIKESIRNSGLMQPLVVTRPPQAAKYMVEAGGNTRLRALQELHEEIGEPQYAEVECVLRPWVSYEHVVIAHLKENDLRGNLTFIEKSLAICALEQRFNQAASQRHKAPLSQRALVSRLRREGYGVNQSHLSYMRYATDRLLSPLGSTLRSGLGRPTIVRVRRLDDAARRLWSAWSIGSKEAFDEAFVTLCQRHDAAFDIDALRRDLEYEISECAETSLEFVRLALNACIEGEDPPVVPAPSACLMEEPSDTAARQQEKWIDTSRNDNASDRLELPAEESIADTPRLAAPAGTPCMALEGLRSNAYQTALRLAQTLGIGELLVETPARGIGFLLVDFPDVTAMQQRNDTDRCALSFLWWTLAALCEVTVMPVEQANLHLPASSRLRAVLDGDDANALFSGIWTVDPGQIAHRFWNGLDADCWVLLMDLMEMYRTLRRCFSPDEPLWKLL